jgi:tetratricopeptide (TPR) repeat protein
VAELSGDARIRDLKRRLELDPSSRLFVTLAEEYRKSGLLPEALSVLQKGLLAHPSYLSAHVALGRAYLEAGQITEAIATFTRVLSSDPGNLVSAKSLADIYLSRGEGVEAIKKYKLYRALSGDRTVDDIIERLQVELAPPPPPRPAEASALPPPPTFFEAKPAGPIRTSRELKFPEKPAPRDLESAEVHSLEFDYEGTTKSRRPVHVDVPSRDISVDELLSRPAPAPPPAPAPAGPPSDVTAPLDTREALAAASSPPPAAPAVPPPPPAASEDLSTRAFRLSDVMGPAASGGDGEGEAEAEPFPGESPAQPPPIGDARSTAPAEPSGRTLADLYYAQGHYTEALRIYDDLVAQNPFDAELKRLRRDAEARLLPAATTPELAAPDAGLTRRLARVRALKRWLAVVQAG